MTRIAKVALLLEAVVCFAPITVWLTIGVLMVPAQVYFAMSGQTEHLAGPIQVVLAVLAGICGLIAMISALSWILFRSKSILNPKIALTFMCLGITGVLAIVFFDDSVVWRAVVALPLACTLHIAYLAREYLFGFLMTPSRP